jgi:hypothetical protein
MNIDIKKIIFACWLGGCLISAFANPNQREDRREDRRESQRAGQQQGYVPERNDPRYSQERYYDPRREPDAEDPRRNGRMSPEERRALRRQINEAGQDIYSRKPQR